MNYRPVQYSEFVWGDKFMDAFPAIYKKTEDALVDFAPVILSHNSDLPITDEILKDYPCKVWIGQNICASDPRCHPIPIGLENDYITGQPARKMVLFEVATSPRSYPSYPHRLCLFNCGMTHPDRESAREYFIKQPWCDRAFGLDYREYLRSIVNHSFIVCPRGNGLDSHRNWEALYLGRYPVMRRMHSLERLYDGLPVLFVDQWNEVTEGLLLETREWFYGREWNWDKLKFSWWQEHVRGLL